LHRGSVEITLTVPFNRKNVPKIYFIHHLIHQWFLFRNIPYAHPLIDKDRFKQSRIKNDTKLSGEGAYDATKDGPLCLQGILFLK